MGFWIILAALSVMSLIVGSIIKYSKRKFIGADIIDLYEKGEISQWLALNKTIKFMSVGMKGDDYRLDFDMKRFNKGLEILELIKVEQKESIIVELKEHADSLDKLQKKFYEYNSQTNENITIGKIAGAQTQNVDYEMKNKAHEIGEKYVEVAQSYQALLQQLYKSKN